MAYDLHIFRGENWFEGTDRPITAEELLNVSGVQPAELSMPGGFSVASPDMFSYQEAILMLRKGMLSVPIRDDAAIEQLRPLADALGAVIQGDEGEYY